MVENPYIKLTAPSTMEFYTTADNYSGIQILPFAHDNLAICFDCRYSGRWISSHAGSNFLMYKVGNKFSYKYASGVAPGDTPVFTEALGINAATGAITLDASAHGSKIILPSDGMDGTLDFYATAVYTNIPVFVTRRESDPPNNMNVTIKAVRIGKQATLTFMAMTGTVGSIASSMQIDAGSHLSEHFLPVKRSFDPHYASWPIFVNNGGEVLGRLSYASIADCFLGDCYYRQLFNIHSNANFGSFSPGSGRGWTEDFSISYYVQ